jgi:hypothetical protein
MPVIGRSEGPALAEQRWYAAVATTEERRDPGRSVWWYLAIGLVELGVGMGYYPPSALAPEWLNHNRPAAQPNYSHRSRWTT